MPARVVVLLRAVNVGGKNKVPMARLREVVADAGASDVETFIASGNLVCTPPPGGVVKFERLVEKLLADEFNVHTSAVSRTGSALRKARDAYPFDVHEEKLCWISFLDAGAKAPGPKAKKAVADADFGDDQAQVIGKELHLRYAAGSHGSKMTPAKLAKLAGADSTARNLRTIDKLIEML